jgi:kynurenine formamidase
MNGSLAAVKGNWGRWGEDDERGAANLITPDSILDALAGPRAGKIYQLGQRIQQSGQPRSPGLRGHQPLPVMHLWLRTGLDHEVNPANPENTDFVMDYFATPIHGSTTHMDGIGHALHDGRFFNGHPATSSTPAGMARCGIDKVGPIVTRGVLLDVGAAKGMESLPGGYEITPDDLQETMERQGVEVRAGDAVLVRTGMYALFERDPDEYAGAHAGVGLDAARLLAERDVIVVGADNRGVEPLPKNVTLPVHRLLLHDHGIYQLEFLNLEELARDEVWESLLIVAPLRITGASGSPVSPFAIA